MVVVMENIFTRRSLVRDSFQVIAYDGIQYGFSFRFNTTDTRGIYLSCLEEFSIELDGVKLNPYDMTICVDGKEYLVALMPELSSVVLDLGKEAVVKVCYYGDLTGEHTISISYNNRVPFIGATGHTIAAPTRDKMTVGV